MRKLIFSSILCVLCSIYLGKSQTSYPDISSLYDIGVRGTLFDESYVELDYLLTGNQSFLYDKDDKDFFKLFGKLQSDDNDVIETSLNRFLDKYPNSFNKQQVSLLLGLYYLKNKEFRKSLYVFDNIKTSSLNKDDITRYYLANAVVKSSLNTKELGRKGSNTNLEVNKLLEDAINIDGKYSEDAFFALAMLKWIEGDRRTAYNILNDNRFSKKLSHKASYWSKVMAFDVVGRDRALSDALRYLVDNKDTENVELKRSVGIAYYNMKDYNNAQRYMSDVYDKGVDDYTFMYSYASSLYELKDYDKAIEVLKSIKADNKTLDSDMLLASCYLSSGDLEKAVNIYSYIIPKLDKGSPKAQIAIYNSALAQNKIGTSSFGESVRLACEFMNRYPKSNKIKVMSDILTKALIDNKNYDESLRQIDKIKYPTKDILKAKQYILVKEANTLQEDQNYWNRKQLLSEAIKLKNISPYYKEALFVLANDELNHSQFLNAIKYSDEAISVDNSLSWHNGLAYYVKGYSLFNNREYMKSFDSFNTFVKSKDADVSLIEDSYIRMGDCMYQGKTNLDKAIEMYRKSESVSNGNDKALFRIANIYETKGEFANEVKVLDQLLSRTKDEGAKPQLLYRKAKAFVLDGNTKKSNSVFETVINKYPDSEYARLSMIENAMAYYNDGNKPQAIAYYKKLIDKYPNSIEASQAISDLKSIYMANGDIEDFINYTKGLDKKFDVSENDKEKLMFSQAESLYQNNDKKAKESLSKYIQTFPDSPYLTKAKSYLADILYNEGDKDNALELYREIENDNSYKDIRQKTLVRLATIYSEKGDNKEASTRFLSLYNTLDKEQDKKEVVLPMLRSLFASTQYHKVDSVMANIDKSVFDENIKSEAYLIWAKSLVGKGEKKKALSILSLLKNKNIDTPIGAESYVLQDQLRFDLNDVANAKKSIEHFIKESSSQQYWLAKAFILLSDIYKKQGDKTTARQYLESLKNSYTNADKEIKDLIEEKLKKL